MCESLGGGEAKGGTDVEEVVGLHEAFLRKLAVYCAFSNIPSIHASLTQIFALVLSTPPPWHNTTHATHPVRVCVCAACAACSPKRLQTTRRRADSHRARMCRRWARSCRGSASTAPSWWACSRASWARRAGPPPASTSPASSSASKALPPPPPLPPPFSSPDFTSSPICTKNTHERSHNPMMCTGPSCSSSSSSLLVVVVVVISVVRGPVSRSGRRGSQRGPCCPASPPSARRTR